LRAHGCAFHCHGVDKEPTSKRHHIIEKA
jgi:hypothetical protein